MKFQHFTERLFSYQSQIMENPLTKKKNKNQYQLLQETNDIFPTQKQNKNGKFR